MPVPRQGFLGRNPITDFTGTVLNHQYYGQCAELEMKAINCLEAYGQVRGIRNCRDILEDYLECYTMRKQWIRFSEIRKERFRQYHEGERSKEELYGEGPREDSFE